MTNTEDPEDLELETEVESGHYNDPGTSTFHIVINARKALKLYVWTRPIAENKFLFIAKLTSGQTAHRAWAAYVRDYVDMTHVRNWVLRDCEFWFDSDALMLCNKFFDRYRYERPPQLTLALTPLQ